MEEFLELVNRLRAFSRRPLLARCPTLTRGFTILIPLAYLDPLEALMGLRYWSPRDYVALTYDPFTYFNYFLVGGGGRSGIEIVLSSICPLRPQL